MKESEFQRKLIKKIEGRLPGCIVMKNDANYRQGFPDLSIFYGNKWATLEVKAHGSAHHQPNQDYWVNRCASMGFSAFIFPENEEVILDAMERTLRGH